MKFLRFSNTDSNYSTTGTYHSWDIPLSLEHRKVGLSSFTLCVTEESMNNLKTEVLEIRCNLLDRNMENQRAVLELVPMKDAYTTFHKSPNFIGRILNKL